jgi:hypothetical protein
MTNTKWLSALLAGTALTVASTAAFADTSLITMKRNLAGEGVTFSISPTADMPAAATEITVAGEVRAILSNFKADGSDSVSDLSTRARLFVRGKTETAVGVVGAKLRVQDSGSQNATINQYTGYWEFAPGLTLTAGRTDSIAAVQYGADWNATGGTWFGEGAALTNSSFQQVNVAFSSGPVAMTLGLEDSAVGPDLAVAASTTFSAGDFGAQLAGKSANVADGSAGDTAYAIGGGLGYSAGAFGLQFGAVTGRGLAGEYSYVAVPTGTDLTDDKFNAMSVLGTFSMTETTSLEAWYGTGTIKDFGTGTDDAKVSGYGAGVFWNPVSQLRLGASVDTATREVAGVEADATQVGVGAWFKF